MAPIKTSDDTLNSFKQQRLKYPKDLITGHLKIYSLRNKLTDFKKLINRRVPHI